jgi:hypothetical protein
MGTFFRPQPAGPHPLERGWKPHFHVLGRFPAPTLWFHRVDARQLARGATLDPPSGPKAPVGQPFNHTALYDGVSDVFPHRWSSGGQAVQSRFVRGRRWPRCVAVVAITALVVAGCVGSTASGSPSVLPGDSPTEAASASAPLASASATATASPTAEPTATPAATDVAKVPLAPSGTWKSIRWVSVPSTPLLPATPSDGAPGVSLFGWSRGYVGFSARRWGLEADDTINTTTTTSYSSDGVHWHAGSVVQQHGDSIDAHEVRAVFEGPDGLLAVQQTVACGDSWVDALLTSRDGVTWQAVDMQKAFGAAVIWDVSGGSAGFVAVDTIGQAVWTSRDGRSWRPVKLRTPVFAGSRIDDGTAFSAGYVLVGSTEKTGARSCGSPPSPTPPLRVPAVWWSANGADWVRVELPGAKAADIVQMSVERLDDNTLVASDDDAASPAVWVSNDGRTWTPTAKHLPTPDFLDGYFMTAGRHGVQLQGLDSTNDNNPYAGGLKLSTWTDGGLVTLTQSGDQPTCDWETKWAVGPTGVVVADAGRLWIGLPSSH